MPSLKSFLVNHGLPGYGLRLTTENVFYPGDIKHEARRRGIKADQVTIVGCSVCQASATTPIAGFFGHLGNCPASHNPSLLAFKTRDGREYWPPKALIWEWLHKNDDEDEQEVEPAPPAGYFNW
jgi:hypothetical protein